jgi:hypothetical protein
MAQVFEIPTGKPDNGQPMVPLEPSAGFSASFPNRRSRPAPTQLAGSMTRIWDRARLAASAQISPDMPRTASDSRRVPGAGDVARLIDPVRPDQMQIYPCK